MFGHNTLPVLNALRFVLAANNLQIAVLCLVSNFYGNLLSDFIAPGYLVNTYGLVFIVLLLVYPLGIVFYEIT